MKFRFFMSFHVAKLNCDFRKEEKKNFPHKMNKAYRESPLIMIIQRRKKGRSLDICVLRLDNSEKNEDENSDKDHLILNPAQFKNKVKLEWNVLQIHMQFY